MKASMLKGLSFGLTLGIITTLGLIVGLNSSTHSQKVIISGILIIAITDAFSDAFGIHISEESEGSHNQKHIWESTLYTFLAKLFFASTFIIPFLINQPVTSSVIMAVTWGLFLIVLFSYYTSIQQKKKPYPIIIEHLIITIIVIILTNYIGTLISVLFK